MAGCFARSTEGASGARPGALALPCNTYRQGWQSRFYGPRRVLTCTGAGGASLQPPPARAKALGPESRRAKRRPVTPPDRDSATPGRSRRKGRPRPRTAATRRPAEVTPAPVPHPPRRQAPQHPAQRQRPIQDAGQPYCGARCREPSRAGFGRDAVETSAFRYDAHTRRDVYDGGFDLKQLTGNLRVDEALSSIADAVDGRRTGPSASAIIGSATSR